MSIAVFFAFMLGAVAVVAAEVLALYWILRRLTSGGAMSGSRVGIGKEDEVGVRDDTAGSHCRGVEKQGLLWVLELDQDRLLEQKNKKELVQVFPVKKFAKIKENDLVLTDPNGSQTLIQLSDCSVQAISSSPLPSRKWVKKYPIRVESKNKIIYNGGKICYLYSETSWEKEAWCRALRLASCSNLEEMKWYTQLCKEFHSYLMSLNSEYPLFLKPSSVAPSEEPEKSNNKMDGNPSKVRYFFKKIAKKASKFGSEPKSVSMPSLSFSKGERKVPSQANSPLPFTVSGSHPPMPTASCDVAAWDEKFASDEGTVCLNLLFSRVFFDIKGSSTINTFIKDRIQRMLSTMRTASYIGGITCKGLDLGGHPPYLHSVKALPIDMNEGWAVEVEIEYSGGFLLEIETRLEVCEPEVQKGIVSTSMEPSSAGDATSDILVGLEDYSHQLNNSTESDGVNQLDEETKPDVSSQLKSGSWASRWRTILNNVSDHVSQVPISLELRVASLRGILHLQMKPPPSDQIWIGFTSMPEIELNFGSCIGDHKIASTHVAMLINNRFKAAIQQSLVQPNVESVCIPWMLAEKNDWLPCSAAPFPWIRQENEELPQRETSKSQQPVISKITSDNSHKGCKNSPFGIVEQFEEGVKSVECLFQSLTEADSRPVSSESGPIVADLGTPPLRNDGNQENGNRNISASSDIPHALTVSMHEQTVKPNEEDAKIKKMGKRDRMLDFRKKMSEKFDEKIRHIEEKGRQIVENVSIEIGRTSVSSDEITTGNDCSTVEDSRMEAVHLTNEGIQKSATFPDKSSSRTEHLEICKLPSTCSLFEQIPNSPPDEVKTKKKTAGRREKIWELGRKMSDKFEEKRRHSEEKGWNILENVPSETRRTSSSSADETTTDNSSVVEDSKIVPHLTDNNFQKSSSKTEHMEPCKLLSTGSMAEQIPNSPEWGAKMKKKTASGRKERIWDLGRKMSDKFDEKRRHIEEKGRHIVEKFSTPNETKP